MCVLNILGGEPWVLKASLGGYALRWVLVEHLRDKIFGLV